MSKKKIALLNEQQLYEMGDALKVQNHQLRSLEQERDEISDVLLGLEKSNAANKREISEIDALLEDIDAFSDDELTGLYAEINKPVKTDLSSSEIHRTKAISTQNDWGKYIRNVKDYASSNDVDTALDPFSTMLGQGEYEKLNSEINDEFAKKTSIVNSTDLAFLAIATALQTAKGIIYTSVADKVGYGKGFDPQSRLGEKQTGAEHKKGINKYQQKALDHGNKEGEWVKILSNPPMYDTQIGVKKIGISLGGANHRLNTLGHDPVLGWIFGTANILTDTITLSSFLTYQGTRDPNRIALAFDNYTPGMNMMITAEMVPMPLLFKRSIEKAQSGKLNLPAAITAEALHLKSDVFTKRGLPVQIINSLNPDLGGKLYNSHYDALCLARDTAVIGGSFVASILIDMIVSLVHGLFYCKDKDGTRDIFEVRTRKILLISNTIATTSNIIGAVITKNPKHLDIGGLLNTIRHLFSNLAFMADVKKEFIENRIYEKIDSEMKAIDNSIGDLTEFEKHLMKL